MFNFLLFRAVHHSLESSHFASAVSISSSRSPTPCDIRGLLPARVVSQSWYLIDTYYTYTRQNFQDGNLSIWNCEFHDFDVSDDDGGALKADHRVDLFNVRFQNCTAGNGGALFGCSSIRCIFTTFTQISSKNGSGLYQVGRAPLSVDSSVFSILEAGDAAGFYKMGGQAHLNTTNFTQMFCSENCGGFESDGGELSGLFLMCQLWYAAKMNSGMVLNGLQSIRIEGCVFHKCRDKGGSSSVIFASNTQLCAIQRCSFHICEGGHNIVFKNESLVIIAHCCFSSNKESAIGEDSGRVRVTNCRFKCGAAMFVANREAGFRNGRTPTYPGDAAQALPVMLVWIRRVVFVWVGLALTLLGEAVAATIANSTRQKCHRRRDGEVV
jgi:hypothetical protein